MLLAAGLGTRLRPLTYEVPKPLVPVLGTPVMEHIARLLARHGFDDVVCNLHYFPEQIEKRFGDGSNWGLHLSYAYEEELLGTAGGVRNVRDHFGEETFLIISGDALTDIDLTALWDAHRAKGGIATLSLKRVDDPSQIGVVILGDDGRIQGFQEKPDPAEALSNLGNCGIYVMEPEIFDFFPDKPFVDWALDVFPTLLAQDVAFYGHEIAEYWNDIGNIREFRQGNFDALTGEVRVEFDPARLNPEGLEIEEPPVYVGDGCEISAGVRLTGPLVMGDRCRVGEAAALRDSVLWPGTAVAPHEVLIGAVAGTGPLADKL
jgi:mannose-1-phosphate guanylyltransferase/mannose-1-phosphate guanylyltransferase/phosphomannomutase